MADPAPGRVTTLTIGGTAIGGIQDATLEINRAQIDVTDKDGAGWDQFIAGQGSAKITGTANYEEGDAGQDAVIDALITGSIVSLVYRPLGAVSTKDEWAVFALVESFSNDSPNKEGQTFPFSFQITEVVTPGVQA